MATNGHPNGNGKRRNSNGNGRRNGPSTNGRSKRARLTEAQRQAFLEHLAEGWTVFASCKVAGIRRRQTVYDIRGRDQEFSDEWDSAIEAGVQVLEQEARRRAVDGYERPVYQGGVLVGSVQEFSDPLLMFLLRARRPHLYRERHEHKHEHRGSVDLRLDRLTEDELAQLEQLVDKAAS